MYNPKRFLGVPDASPNQAQSPTENNMQRWAGKSVSQT